MGESIALTLRMKLDVNDMFLCIIVNRFDDVDALFLRIAVSHNELEEFPLALINKFQRIFFHDLNY